EGGREQQGVFERRRGRFPLPSAHPSASTSSRKRSPRASKSLNASKLAQEGESRTTSPLPAAAAAASTARSRPPTSEIPPPASPAGASSLAIRSAASPIR